MSKPRVGICLPVFAGASAWDHSLDFGVLKSLIPKWEEMGFNSLWVPDHLTMGDGGRIFECWTVLAAASQLCESMRLGTLVLCANHRSPAVLAKMAATLDVISNGRLELGVGAGWRASEQLSYGLKWEPSVKVRVKRLIESVEIIRGMWTNDNFSYSGQYYKVDNATCSPRPLQKPHPRIWLAGKGERIILKAIARYADGWNVDEISPKEYARKLEVLRGYCDSVGTDCERIDKSLETIILISDKKEELQRVVEWSKWYAGIQAEYGTSAPAQGDLAEMKSRYLLGSVREVTERIAEYVAVGVQQFMVYFLDYPSMRSMKLLAEDVMPSL